MIIQCETCKAKFRFDEAKIEGDGIWVRCSRCRNVFFLDNPVIESVEALADEIGHEEDMDNLGKILDEIAESEEDRLSEEIAEEPYIHEGVERESVRDKKRRVLWSPLELVVYVVVVLIVTGGVYFWLFPDLGIKIVDRISTLPVLERFLQSTEKETEVHIAKSEIDLVEIEEKYIKNWIIGDLLVIEGIAVNTNSYPVSKIKLRGKVLDSSGKKIAEEEAYCGNIINEEELSNLTEIEIKHELSNPYGGSFPNNDVPYGGKIPFMLVFSGTVKDVSEFTVELAGVEKAE